MTTPKIDVLKEREPISNVRCSYEINPYLKQLKTLENRLKHPRAKSKTNDIMRKQPKPREKWQNNAELIRYTKNMINKGLTMDFFQTENNKENKFQEVLEEENEDRARQQELWERIRSMRVQSRDVPRLTDHCRDETTSSQIALSEAPLCKPRTSHTSHSVCDWEKENQRKDEKISFYKYKRNKRSVME